MKRKIVPTLAILALSLALVPTASSATLSGKVEARGQRHNGDAVVYVDTIPGKTFAPPDKPVQIDQKGMEFVPHVQPVLVGTTVDFLNSDAFLHNVFTPDKCAGKFNLGTWPQGQSRSYKFEQPCVAVLLCNVHPEMEAFVVTVPTPYFAVTDRKGAYSIDDLPDGTYTLKIWHPKLKEISQSVTVSGSTTVDIELKK